MSFAFLFLYLCAVEVYLGTPGNAKKSLAFNKSAKEVTFPMRKRPRSVVLLEAAWWIFGGWSNEFSQLATRNFWKCLLPCQRYMWCLRGWSLSQKTSSWNAVPSSDMQALSLPRETTKHSTDKNLCMLTTWLVSTCQFSCYGVNF